MVLLPLILAAACAPAPDPSGEGRGDDTSASIPSSAGLPSGTPTAGTPAGEPDPTEPSNRDRLLLGYLGYLQLDPTHAQTNGMRGADLADVCALWEALDWSSRGTFLTLTARLEGSVLQDGSSMLDHAVTAYRVVGGEDAVGDTDPGSCGGGEFNRLILSIDPELHAELVATHAAAGTIADIPVGGVWRNSHDLAGPHDPFTMSVETEDDLPRGQAHFFADPLSVEALAPLGRQDLEGLVDPYAFEIDQDYDCVHNSNPACEYVFYGAVCLPEPLVLGATMYANNYGSFDPGWLPAGCP